VAAAVDRFGTVDAVVNNAGSMTNGMFHAHLAGAGAWVIRMTAAGQGPRRSRCAPSRW
jgi:NADP-dependent 3-hydroxy acid dehydrogenase YdfG